jgi:hypothetical protein
MKRYIATGFVIALMTSHAPARIGETPEQLQQRYGAPIKQAFGDGGEGMCVYHADGFKEIRVHFSEGRSDQEDFLVILGTTSFEAKADLAKRVQSENPNQHVQNGWYDRVRVSSKTRFEGIAKPRDNNVADDKRSYSGIAKIKTFDLGKIAVLNDDGMVIEWPAQLELHGFEVKPGHSYTVTVLPNSPGYVGAPSVVVSKREHMDWQDSNEDAAAHQQLVRVSEGNKVLLDRSVCSLHKIKMEKRKVDIAYGLTAPSSDAELYCVNHFPNCADYALGGCDWSEDSPKSAVIYICPKCVAECNEYKRWHPEKDVK